MKITDEIVMVLVSGSIDYPEEILDSIGVSYKGLSEEETFNLCDNIIAEHFNRLEDPINNNYYDLEKSSVYSTLYYEDLDTHKFYGIDYRNYIGGFEVCSEPYRVQRDYELVRTVCYTKINETD